MRIVRTTEFIERNGAGEISISWSSPHFIDLKIALGFPAARADAPTMSITMTPKEFLNFVDMADQVRGEITDLLRPKGSSKTPQDTKGIEEITEKEATNVN